MRDMGAPEEAIAATTIALNGEKCKCHRDAGRLDAEAVELSQKRQGVALLGLDDVHKGPDGAENLDNLVRYVARALYSSSSASRSASTVFGSDIAMMTLLLSPAS